jgi:catechol 2,3-dioxygenase-like lactoylglutathione lyase family enzyme
MTVHHVALEATHEAAQGEVAFWAMLGFEEVAPPETLRDRARWVQRGGTQIHVMYKDAPTVPPAGHAAVVAPDYEATLDRLRSAEIDIEPRPAHWGAARCFVRSPAGHRVEVMAAPPP